MAQKCPYCHNARSGDMSRVPCPYCGQVVKNDQRFTQRFKSTTNQLTFSATPPTIITAPLASAPASATQAARKRLIATAARRGVSQAAKAKPSLPLRFFNFILVCASFTAWLVFMTTVGESYANRECWRCTEQAPLAAIMAFIYFVLPRKSPVRWTFGLGVMGLTALLLFFKPIIAPVFSTWSEQGTDGITTMHSYTLSFDSETHMYYWLPGLILFIFTVLATIVGVTKIFKRMTSQTN